MKTKIVGLDLFQELKTVNREVVFGLLEKIRKNNDPEYIPLLKVWQSDEVRKVRERIESVLKTLGDKPGAF